MAHRNNGVMFGPDGNDGCRRRVTSNLPLSEMQLGDKEHPPSIQDRPWWYGTPGRLRPVGQPVIAGTSGVLGASGGGGILSSFYSFLTVLSMVVATIAVAGVAVSTGLWAHNVNELYAENRQDRDSIAALEAQIQAINQSLPDGNGTTFFDDTWVMAHAGAPSQKFMLNASQVTPGIKRNYAGPDADGVIALQETLPTTFPENLFAVTGDSDNRQLQLDLSLFSPDALRILKAPNKNGVIATIQDIVLVAGNSSEFLDSEFGLLNDPDITKLARVNLSLFDTNTNHTFFLPNLTGILLLTTGNQTISDKILDNSNSVTVLDTALTIEDAGNPGSTAQFRVPNSGTQRTYTLADGSMVLVGRGTGGLWNLESLGLTGTANTFNAITMNAAANIDRFFRFGSVGSGQAGVMLSSFSSNNWAVLGDGSAGGDFRIYWNNSIPSANNELGDAVLSVDAGTKDLQLHQSGDDTVYEALDVSQLTAPRTGTFPDTDCTFLCEAATQNVTNKNLDTSNTITVLDTGLAIENAGGVQLTLNTSGLSTDQTLSPPDNSGEIALNYNEETVYVQLTTTFSVPDNTMTKIEWDDPPLLDANGNWDTGTNEYTCPEDGLYRISCYIEWTSAAGGGNRKLFLTTSGSIGSLVLGDDRNVGTNRVFQGSSVLVPLNATDTLYAAALQDSGGANDITSMTDGASTTYMTVEYIGPHSQTG